MSDLSGLASLPVIRATMRERGPAVMPAAMAALMALAGASNARSAGWGGDTFSGFARVFLIGLTMALGAGLIADEIDSGHAQLVLLRPLTRAAWFGGRLLGAGGVLACAVFATWLFAGVAVLTGPHGGGLDLGWALALPLTIIEGLGWLSLLAMLSVVFSRWMNVGFLLMLILTFFFLTFTLPLALGRPGLIETMRTIMSYLGPQGLENLLRFARQRARPDLSPLFYNLLWLFGCWLAGALLLNRREIARRKG